MRLKLCLLALVSLLAPPLAHAEPLPAAIAPLDRAHPLAGRVWLPQNQRFATPEEVVEQARAADVVMLGETHDNPDHHALQAWMLRRVLEGGKRPMVAFEMLSSDQAEPLARHLEARPGDAAGLGAAVEWDKAGWPDWALYRPIAEAALAAGAPLAAANLSRDHTREIAKGGIPKSLRDRLNLEAPLDPGMRQAMEAEIQASHCDMLPERALPAMVRVQRARDASMADALARGLREQGSAVLIAGSGHVRTDRGVPFHLAGRAPGRRVFALAFVEVRPDRAAPQGYAELADEDRLPYDAVWFTPRAEREDQCEAFKRHMEKKER